MEQNPLKDLAENMKQRNLEDRMQAIQDQMTELHSEMQTIMNEFERLISIYSDLGEQLAAIERRLEEGGEDK